MGISATIAVADSELTEEHLAQLGLAPLGASIRAEDVVLVSDDERACVRRADGWTVIVDGGTTVGAALEDGQVRLPGTVHVASAVSAVDFADYRVLRDGETIRCLIQDDGELTSDDGEPVADESEFFFREDAEIDGDALLSLVPQLAGMPGKVDPLAVEGQAYAGAAPQEQQPAPQEQPAPKRRGLLSRLFGA